MKNENNIYYKPELLLQKLIQFNTTNPPGNEAECIKFIEKLLNDNGIETKILYKDENRLNLVAKLKGKGTKLPFLMYGHIDVVSTENQDWSVDPFAGTIKDGYLYGRGTLDMKGAVAMFISALIRLKQNDITPDGDIILAIVSDEECDSEYGAKYLVDNHAELFEGVKYAIGEMGGFTMPFRDKKFYPIMISEKQRCNLKATITGKAGHGAFPMRDGSMAKLGKILTTLNKKSLPVHITEPSKLMIEAIAENTPTPIKTVLTTLLKENLCNKTLKLMGSNAVFFEPLLHNTINATIVNGGKKINIIPSEITLECDGRLLPGETPETMIKEIEKLVGNVAKWEVTTFSPGPQNLDMTLFNKLAEILKQSDPDAIAIPYVLGGITDARYFSKLEIQTYGFTPMILPKEMNFSTLIHNADERIPVESVEFGTNAIYRLLTSL